MALRCGTRAAAQHKLIAHELAVVLPHQSLPRLVAGVGVVVRLRPFPHVAKHLRRAIAFGVLQRQGVVCGAFHKVAGERCFYVGCSQFPFELGGQPSVRPTCKGICLKIVQMTGRGVRVNFHHALQGKVLIPRMYCRAGMPVQRQSVLPGLHPVPTHSQPQLRPLVATIRHECQVIAICHQPTGQLKRCEVSTVARRFIVKCKRMGKVI